MPSLRVRLIPAASEQRGGHSGPPLWLLGSLACLALPALFTTSVSRTPVRTAQPRSDVSTAQLRMEAPELYATLPILNQMTRLQTWPGTTGPATAFPQLTPVSAPVAKPARITRAASSAQQTKTTRTPPTRAFEGTLLVTSDPVGATVFLDRRRVGETPLQITKVRAGSHAVWVESEGYVRWTAGVLVRFNSVTRVEPTLQRRTDR